jgi:very-short-patch-repair endonuclease
MNIEKTNKFIEKSKLKHGNLYNYNLVDYINAHKKVKIICEKHGSFEQRPNDHLNGSGCSLCNGGVRLDTKQFIIKSKEIHGNRYDYSLSKYKTSYDKIKIICKEHGIFNQKSNGHLNGKGCPFCNGGVKLTKNIFIKKSKQIHGNTYDYSLVDYINTKTKVKIICKEHGVFTQLPYQHLSNNGCPICKESKGEKEIRNILNINNIIYKTQKRFENCKDKLPLPFDFYLPNYNLCIEYDGKQHFESINFFGGNKSFILQQKRDKIKNIYCKENNIKLLRIKYDENINEKLNKSLIEK